MMFKMKDRVFEIWMKDPSGELVFEEEITSTMDRMAAVEWVAEVRHYSDLMQDISCFVREKGSGDDLREITVSHKRMIKLIGGYAVPPKAILAVKTYDMTGSDS